MSSRKKMPSSEDRSESASEKVRLKVIARRKELELTQRAVADKVGVMESTIANWESGRRSLDWMVRAKRYCDALDMPIDELVEDEEDTAKTLEELVTLATAIKDPKVRKQLVETWRKEIDQALLQPKTDVPDQDTEQKSNPDNSQDLED